MTFDINFKSPAKAKSFQPLTNDETYDVLYNIIVKKQCDIMIYKLLCFWLTKLARKHKYILTLSPCINTLSPLNNAQPVLEILHDIVYDFISESYYMNNGSSYKRGDVKSLRTKVRWNDPSLDKGQVVSYLYRYVDLLLYRLVDRHRQGEHHSSITNYVKLHKAHFDRLKEKANEYNDIFILDPLTIHKLELEGYTASDIYTYRARMYNISTNETSLSEDMETHIADSKTDWIHNEKFVVLLDKVMGAGVLSLREKYLLSFIYQIPIDHKVFCSQSGKIVSKYVTISKLEFMDIFADDLVPVIRFQRVTYRYNRKYTTSEYRFDLLPKTEFYKNAITKIKNYINQHVNIDELFSEDTDSILD